ncbi:unnamed protein product [Boreogadus saida]
MSPRTAGASPHDRCYGDSYLSPPRRYETYTSGSRMAPLRGADLSGHVYASVPLVHCWVDVNFFSLRTE